MEVVTRLCVVWKTNLPNYSNMSPTFIFQASPYYLKLINTSPDSYELVLQEVVRCLRSNGSFKTFDVTVMFEREMGEKLFSVGSRVKVKSGSTILWKFTLNDVVKYCSTRSSSHTVAKIVCNFQGDTPSEKKKGSPIESVLNFNRSLESLSRDLSGLLKDETFPDVKLSYGDRTIAAHRSVLAARSEVFAAMFRNDMLESKTGVVDVTDMDAPVIDLFLEYVYSGKLPAVSDAATLSGLYAAADKYAVQALGELCRELMIGRLADDNCINFLTVADFHSDVALKDSVVSFICEREDVILDSEAWLSFSETSVQATKLANEVYRNFVRSKSKKPRLG